MIRLHDVSLCLGNASRTSAVQFHLPAFEVAAGETVVLTGPSGCGKSTLLNLVASLRRADAGEVTVANVDLATLSPAQLDRHRGTHCGMVLQTFHLLAPFTAIENVTIGLRFGARKRDNTRRRADEVLRRVGLGDRLHARPHQLSVGERQRVAIARAIAGGAPILLADEPTGSLDPDTGREIFALLQEVATEDGRTLLMVTHDPALAAELPRRLDCTGLIRSTIIAGGRDTNA
ncbi:MAG: ATP-binding cassette domain-containing protein [Verrucomicrobiaceae bacterium]|nr:ATP-binding cassette domain-containing protein [Verrucomicrobiaceae bacterium]NCF92313.1 ATP-binding cassette domain-containing protein [Verrucomicrobiaceae bacterium]